MAADCSTFENDAKNWSRGGHNRRRTCFKCITFRKMPNILIVEDDPILRNLLMQIVEPFEDLGVELITAENGEIALKKIRDERPKIVLLDVMMPKMNGFEVCDIVKKDPKLRDTYIVILTAKGQETDRQKAKDLGVDYYVTKPFNPDELIRKLTEILNISSS